MASGHLWTVMHKGRRGKIHNSSLCIIKYFFITTFNGLPVLVMVCGLTWLLTETPKKFNSYCEFRQLTRGTNAQHA